MASFWDRTTREQICRRVERLSAAHEPLWGKMNAAQMLAHVNDAMRMAMGELPVADRRGPLRQWPLKQLVIYTLPWPKGAPTAPELLARLDTADLRAEQEAFGRIAERLAQKPASAEWPAHPAFGPLTHRAWGVLEFRHADHHLRQFGV
jgi:hypothetical protein